ncbi:chorismate mutase [Sporomusa sp.]|jgi:chorismate mutase|uniref:chorismate mutase n=1 Tax=Sporomusa sp. TaxID=2078658 RepID=UPI002C176B63|nr:chorismate mutase [Sporomusa sp.]HWR06969.1 chorismate mutase [Sporomusa sp.]
MLRGIRGATTVTADIREEIFERVAELLSAIVQENAIDIEDIGAVIFSTTPDLTAAFPAAGARKLGWTQVPLFGTQEIECPEAVPLCIRVLILWNTDTRQRDIKHVYLHDATSLRQDIKL